MLMCNHCGAIIEDTFDKAFIIPARGDIFCGRSACYTKQAAAKYYLGRRYTGNMDVDTAPLVASDFPKIMPPFPGVTIGADPELFVIDPGRKTEQYPEGTPVPAGDFLPGSKEQPHPVACGAVQVDGMAAEFNINPAHTFEEFDSNIETVLAKLRGMLPSGLELRAWPSVRFPAELFDAQPESAKELGCQPDFDAWTGDVNPPPDAPDDPYLRTAAGHIHFGWKKPNEPAFDLTDLQHIINCRDLIRQLDWYLGGWSVLVDPDVTRRKLYGKAGAFRPKPYGAEYRVLSNFWVMSKETRLQVWNRLQVALMQMKSRYFLPEYGSPPMQKAVIEYINTASMPAASNGFSGKGFPFTRIDLNYKVLENMGPTSRLKKMAQTLQG